MLAVVPLRCFRYSTSMRRHWLSPSRVPLANAIRHVRGQPWELIHLKGQRASGVVPVPEANSHRVLAGQQAIHNFCVFMAGY